MPTFRPRPSHARPGVSLGRPANNAADQAAFGAQVMAASSAASAAAAIADIDGSLISIDFGLNDHEERIAAIEAELGP